FNEIRKEVGDKVFFETLNEYYNKYKHKNANGRAFVELWNSKGVDLSYMTLQEIKEANTGSKVFLKAKIKVLDAMEDIDLSIE
ncbi:hypothetical protein ACTPEM_26575, partial [Clostridioides difficile]